MEYVDVLDELGEKTGIVKERSIAKKDKDYTLGVHVWILTPDHHILLQKRSFNCHNFPGMWDMTGGHVRAGESSIEAMRRELLEELGISVDSSELQFLFRHPAQQNHIPMFLDVYLLEKDVELNQLVLQKEEVEETCFIPCSLLYHWSKEMGELVPQPYLSNLFHILKEKTNEH